MITRFILTSCTVREATELTTMYNYLLINTLLLQHLHRKNTRAKTRQGEKQGHAHNREEARELLHILKSLTWNSVKQLPQQSWNITLPSSVFLNGISIISIMKKLYYKLPHWW